MVRRNIYEGTSSCYALNEGIYVEGRGINYPTALGISYLILRDLERGWTYDHGCVRIPMNTVLARKRLNYLYPLALKHYGVSEAEKVNKLLIDIYRNNMKIPYEHLVNLYHYNVLKGLKIAIPVPVPIKVPVKKKLKATYW